MTEAKKELIQEIISEMRWKGKVYLDTFHGVEYERIHFGVRDLPLTNFRTLMLGHPETYLKSCLTKLKKGLNPWSRKGNWR